MNPEKLKLLCAWLQNEGEPPKDTTFSLDEVKSFIDYKILQIEQCASREVEKVIDFTREEVKEGKVNSARRVRNPLPVLSDPRKSGKLAEILKMQKSHKNLCKECKTRQKEYASSRCAECSENHLQNL